MQEESYYSVNSDSSLISSAVSPSLTGKTLSAEMWFQRNGLKTSVQIGPDRLERKSATACEGNNNNAGVRGCFHKADLHVVLTLLNITQLTREDSRKTASASGLS